jgi:hypothetical protein
MFEFLRKLVVSIAVWTIAIFAFLASLFIAIVGFWDGNFAGGILGVAGGLVSLAFMVSRSRSQYLVKPMHWLLSVGLGLIVVSAIVSVIGIYAALILLGILLILGVVVSVWSRHQNAQTLKAYLDARLRLLGFEEKPYSGFGGFEFTREGIIIREDRTDVRESMSVELFCDAPNAVPLKQTFKYKDDKARIAAVTNWLLENKIMDLEKAYSDALYQEQLNRR